MSTNSNIWNESLINEWAETQRKYWETWGDFAKNAGMGAFAGGNGQSFAANAFPFAQNLFSQNPFAQNPFAQNPFAQNPFAQNPFAQNPFAQNPFAQNPFAQNPFAQNPFAQDQFNKNPFALFGSGDNPFAGMLDQWWSTIQPEAQGDLGTVAQRFYDMGKSFMSMTEGLFGVAGQDQPDAAMSMWMTSMQAALQQWIAQIQANADFATPDLPGVSGTTLSSWAQFADSVAPWLNMSQNLLREIAEGHLPGGVEIPGMGAAQEQFCRALSMPGLGYTREQQEHLQGLARNLLTYHDALRAYKLAFAKTALASLDSVKTRLQDLHANGEKIDSLRGLYDMWVDASEDAYGDFATSDEYQVVYGDLINALMQVRKDINVLAEQHYVLMNIPTRSEINTMQHRQQENRRENRQLRREIAGLRAQVEKLAGGKPASSRGRRNSPAQESLPMGDVEDDLTAIKGIGPKMAEKLYEQGIKNFSNLASLNAKFAEDLDEALKTQGRILRDDWIGQAKKLLG
jgi:class III poly(R)-hydroxyalkanoic acid synthase PhaE subunit